MGVCGHIQTPLSTSPEIGGKKNDEQHSSAWTCKYVCVSPPSPSTGFPRKDFPAFFLLALTPSSLCYEQEGILILSRFGSTATYNN